MRWLFRRERPDLLDRDLLSLRHLGEGAGLGAVGGLEGGTVGAELVEFGGRCCQGDEPSGQH